MTSQVLLVDDDPDFLEALLRRFSRGHREWHIATAYNGVEAVRVAGEQTPDVLVTDILMPVSDGIETIRSFRQNYPSVRIVAMSGGGRHVGVEPLTAARLLGAEEILEKPFDFAALQDAIQALLALGPNRTP